MVNSYEIFKSFYNVVGSITGYKVVQSFIDDFIYNTNKKFQNQVVINPPMLPVKPYNFANNQYKSSSVLTIEIYATTMKSASNTYDTVCRKILLNKSNLNVKITEIGDSTPAVFNEAGTSIKMLTIPVSFEYDFDVATLT